jgi:hypothetical protein
MDRPFRKVRSNGRTVVGLHSSHKNAGVQFESGLERRFLNILAVDTSVKSYWSQPVVIKYFDDRGKERIYTPDFLVEYYDGNHVLVEVKSNSWLEKNPDLAKILFYHAEEFSKQKGWTFQVATENDIKTTRGDNAQFLFRFLGGVISTRCKSEILEALAVPLTVNEVLDMIQIDRGDALQGIWTLVADGTLGFDQNEKLTMNSRIWVVRVGEK